jgi:hypothetical protein
MSSQSSNYSPGYRDRLSFDRNPFGGQGFGGGFGGQMPWSPGSNLPDMPGVGMALSQSLGDRAGDAARGAGRHVKGALDWLTDDEHGAGRINAIANVVGTGAGIYGAHKDRQAWAEEMERQRLAEEEDKKRRAGYGPLMGSVLERMMTSASGGGG